LVTALQHLFLPVAASQNAWNKPVAGTKKQFKADDSLSGLVFISEPFAAAIFSSWMCWFSQHKRQILLATVQHTVAIRLLQPS
jgi:hypothetical protein